MGKSLPLDLTTRGLCRPRLRSAGTSRISIRIHLTMCWRCRGGKGSVEGKMTPDDPYRMDEGQGVRIAPALTAGLDHQVAQGQMDKQESVEFLFGQIGTARAQHQLLARQRDLEFGEGSLLLPPLMVQRREF